MATIDLLTTKEDRTLLRWGGLAGVVGGVLLVVVFVIVGVFVGTFAGPEAEVAAYPDVRAARTVENGLYLLVLVLWAVHLAGLHRALRSTSPAPAVYGSVLGLIGMAVLAAGALPHVVTATVSEAYHASGTTPEERVGLVHAWQASQGVIDSLLIVGLVIATLGLLLLGVALTRTRSFGTRVGHTAVGLGVVGVASALVAVAVPESPIGAVGMIALLVFHVLVGSKMLRLPPAR